MAAQFLLFAVGGLRLAMPVDRVDGVLPKGPVTPLPFVPAWVDGLVVVRGAVLPQYDLLLWRTGERHDNPNHELLKIATPEGPAVVKVDRVLRLLAEADLDDGVETIDPAALVLGDIAEDIAPAAASDFAEPPILAAAPVAAAERAVVVAVAGESLGLPLRYVREVVELGDVSPLPLAPPALSGLFRLRGREVPLVSMAALLGGVPRGGDRAVIVDTADGPMALAVDRILGIERIGTLDAHPLLEQWHGLTGCWHGAGGGTIGLVSLDDLFNEGWRARLAGFLPEAGGTAEERAAEPSRLLMTFSVAGRPCAMDALEVERVVAWQPPGAVPDGNPDIDGVVPVGGGILPVVDLCGRLGLDADAEPPRAYLVVRWGAESAALCVGRPGRMRAVPVSAIQPLGAGGAAMIHSVARIDDTLTWVLSLRDLDAQVAA